MTPDELRAKAEGDEPLDGLPPLLAALTAEAAGDWDRAHALCNDQEGADAAWVHAYLHRVEGDLANAAYWYRRADRPRCDEPLEEEWRTIAAALLAHGRG